MLNTHILTWTETIFPVFGSKTEASDQRSEESFDFSFYDHRVFMCPVPDQIHGSQLNVS